ncbi:hypothetical protein T05_9409 [Trichinella murrelli]|uniref:Integrase catalytic domain-containing protein n=1 Tax=Trichinella murrelli TaxID=144512 RepID=A0A0V0UI92_9BILA|nr:hypothetical protein T05_9409 [Trichinella murrelli]
MTKMLCGLNPLLDEFRVLRVGGRLGRAQLEEETKFRALLPRKGIIVDSLIRREHNRQLLAGVAQTLTKIEVFAVLRKRFWILRGRSAVKRVLRTSRPFRQRIGDLPAIRVNPARPFSNVGIVFVGPLLIRSESSKYVSKKAYIFLFTCMVLRAIHLELVPDQTIQRFLRAWRRFVTRRGSSWPFGQIVELLTGVTGCQGRQRSRPRQVPCADGSAPWSCWKQPKLINGLHPLRGSLLEIILHVLCCVLYCVGVFVVIYCVLWFITTPLYICWKLFYNEPGGLYLSAGYRNPPYCVGMLVVIYCLCCGLSLHRLPKLNLPEVSQVASSMRVSPMKKKVEIRRSALKKKMDHLERLWRENALHLELRLHLQETITLYEQLDGFQLEFEEELEAEDAEIESDIWAGLRNRFLSLRANVESSMAAKKPMDSVSHEGRKVRLPHFELPKFDGDVTRFREFWDQFEASVHQQTDLCDATMMAYLRSCLTGVALDALQGLSAANQGYETAVQRLKGCFDRPQVAVRQHIIRFFRTLSKSSDLSAICDECHRGVYSLTALGKDPRNGGLSTAEVIIAVARERLPNSVRIQWDKLTMENQSLVAYLPGFLRFLHEQVELADTTRRARDLRLEDKRSENASEKQGSSGKGRETQKTVAFFHSAVAAVCGFCQKQHTIAECASLKQASRQKQREMATRYRLCFCCLKPGHVSSACKTDRRRKRPASKDSSAVVSVGTTTTERVQETPTTIKVRAFGDAGSGITVTCLLDTGAEYSFIREDVASALGVVGRAQPVKVEGSQVVQLWLGRLDGSQNAERYPLEALTVPSLCHRIPVSKILTSEWEHLQFLDPVIDDESSDEVHVVIGIDYYYRFLGDAIRRGKPGDPVAVETVLGWIICGPVNPHPAPETVAAFNAVVEPKVEDLLRRFWEIEEMGVPFRSESDEVDPEKRFREGLSYDGTRYSVRLLWKNSGCWLPDNFAVAKRRLETLERRMAREPSRRDVHSSILHSYLVNGWAEEITSEGPEGRTWYLPQHVVSQQGPGATKHRIVFDASAKFKGTSLNEQLDSGLKLQADLLGILLRFRRFRVALQSDIAKMFLQVGLREEDRDVCRFLWRKDGPGGPIATYRLTRVCFGLACSPYLAMQVVNHHLREKRDCFGTVVDDIMAGMYVDDLVVSCDSIEEARDFAHRSSELLASGGFHLAKWASNAPEALVDRPTEEIFRDRYSCLWKTLGVSWNPQEDELTFRPPELAASQNQETKRDLLRTAASVFDPLGGLTPFTVRAKQMFQSLWQTGMAWDDNLPAEVELQWRVWKLELNELHCIAMPRAYFPFSPTEASRLELHGFGDASEAAYAAVVYLRAVKTPDDVQVSFVTAKSRVAPLKKLSTPRLELMAALLCARLVCYVRKELALNVEACHCWSDSKVALGWINGDANRWKPFVANRVREIQALTPSLWWRYIPTEDNPADLASRGCTGPTWLRGSPETWPEAEREERIESLEVLEKERRATAVLVTVSPPQDAANVINPGRYSGFERLIRVTAWCRRFRHNTTMPACSRRTGIGLTSDELKEAERIWIRQEQIHAFCLKESLDKAMTKMLCGLNPFLDEFGVLRVGGRLGRAQLEEETKFPALLPRKGMIVDLLIRREHNRQLHAGVAQTLAALRERFWILRGCSAVKHVLRTCGICRRVAARPFQQRMGDLPVIRVNPARPFSNVGIDFVGPLLVRSESSKSVIKKAYICLFTSIHLELVPDQTIESFLRALRRFVARRGRPDTIQSDNFRTFHQANAFLKHLFSRRNWETVQRHLASERVEWIFITERSPWCGGYWERLVRSVKTALKATLGQCLAAPDELRTVLCEVEARVNDRPLTFVGSDLDEEMALTPAHFLIGRSLASFPDRSNSADRGTLRSSLRHLLHRWSYQQKLVGAFWKRWKREYVVTLSSRGKWKKLHEQPRVGDVVLVADYNTPRRRWSLGRIVELLTGGGGLTRSAKVKTAAGTLCRSVRTLVLLEPAEAY